MDCWQDLVGALAPIKKLVSQRPVAGSGEALQQQKAKEHCQASLTALRQWAACRSFPSRKILHVLSGNTRITGFDASISRTSSLPTTRPGKGLPFSLAVLPDGCQFLSSLFGTPSRRRTGGIRRR